MTKMSKSQRPDHEAFMREALRSALHCLKAYRAYGEAMRAHGRGFEPTDDIGRGMDSVLLHVEQASR